MVASDAKQSNIERPFTIENNVLKGKVVVKESRYNSLGKLLFDALKSHPDAIGQVDAITEVEDSYASITDRTIKCALWLQKQGVGKGDIVVISSHNHLDSLIPCLAAIFLGAIFQPWDYNMNIQLARHFMTLSKPKVIFANEKSAGVILEASKIEVFYAKMVSFGNYPGTVPFSEVLEGHSKSSVENFQCKDVNDPHHTAIILFSSGTTGLPKGTQISHRVMVKFMETEEGFVFDDLVPMWFSSLYWISGSFLSLKSIAAGTKRIIAPDFTEKVACELIEKFKVSWLMLSTSMSNRLVRYSHLHDYDLSSLKFLFTGGATLKKESQDQLKKHLPHTTILQAYGLTELGGLVTVQRSNSTSGSCGLVNKNCEIKVVDTETGKALGPNETGEICVKSWAVMTGYYNNPEATKNIIDRDGWLHTGDLGYYNEEGEFFIVDRLKEIIKYRGHQIVPTEIENILQSHPSVVEAAVVGVPHPTDDEHCIAFVSKVPNEEVSAQELIKLVDDNVMDHCKLRGGVKFLPSLPHTPSGKISKRELKSIAKRLANY